MVHVAMVHVGMSDQEMTTFIKETICVDSTYTAKQLFDAAELPPSWESVRTMLKLSAARGNELQNALSRKRLPFRSGTESEFSESEFRPTDRKRFLLQKC